MIKHGLPKEEKQARKFLKFIFHDLIRELRLNLRQMFNWYFFYKPEDSADKVWHFICVAIVDVILLKIFGLI